MDNCAKTAAVIMTPRSLNHTVIIKVQFYAMVLFYVLYQCATPSHQTLDNLDKLEWGPLVYGDEMIWTFADSAPGVENCQVEPNGVCVVIDIMW